MFNQFRYHQKMLSGIGPIATQIPELVQLYPRAYSLIRPLVHDVTYTCYYINASYYVASIPYKTKYWRGINFGDWQFLDKITNI